MKNKTKYLVPENLQSAHALIYQVQMDEGEGWRPLTVAGRLEFMVAYAEMEESLRAARLERKINRIRNAVGASLCCLIVVLVAYFMRSFVGQQ